MNERIRELIEQAHEQKPVIVLDPETCQPTHKIGNGGVPMYHSELNPEKFAELIIAKCVEEAGEPADGLIKGDTWHDGVRASVWSIKQYFGVK